jgi:hypothetical protein
VEVIFSDLVLRRKVLNNTAAGLHKANGDADKEHVLNERVTGERTTNDAANG